MRKMKKLASMMLALVMVCAMSVTAFAADGYTITINNDTSGYVYTAYQIFAGNLYTDETGNKILSNVVWGSAIAESAQSNALAAVKAISLSDKSTPFASCTSAADIAAVLSGKSDDSEIAQAFAEAISTYATVSAGTSTTINGDYVVSNLDVGYYLVKSTTVPENGAYTRYILAVVGNAIVKTKSNIPSVDKEVSDVDANIGDTVTYTLTATLPTNYADYDTYKLVFHDTLSSGLTFNNDVTVTVGETKVDSSCYTVSQSCTDDCTFEIIINNVNTLIDADSNAITVSNSSEIVVTYTAGVNNNAVIGGNGNTNEVKLEYSNNPNSDGSGDTGNTPGDKVVTWTFELDVTKTNGEETRLEDAQFILYKTVTEGKDEETENVTYYLIASETTTTVAETDDEGNETTTTVGTGTYTVTGWTTNEGQATTLTSASDGTFEIKGLDAGTYYLKETKAPDGYNLLESPITLVITATYGNADESGDITELTGLSATADNETLTATASTGIVKAEVENNAGSTLPSTGGIGTTIFYVVGTILVLGAAVLLITRARMSKAE